MRHEINVQTGDVTEYPDAPSNPLTEEQIIAGYVSAMESHYDTVAREKKYDNRFSCALRAGYAGPFQAEGVAFAVWMDQCNAYAYQELEKVKTGQRQIPEIEEFINELPASPW